MKSAQLRHILGSLGICIMLFSVCGYEVALAANLNTKMNGRSGNENGGGGDKCKSDFMDRVSALKNASKDNPTLLSKFPFLNTVYNTVDPNQNPGFLVAITDKPINGCPNSASPIACSVPKLNRLTLFCGENGWLSLPSKERDKQALHELLWWSNQYDDSNYFYSKQVVDSMSSFSRNVTWIGQGSVFTPGGLHLADFGISIEVIPNGTVINLKTTFSYSDGSTATVMEKMDFGTSGTAFLLTSDLGSGSGACYGEGVCQMSVTDGLGHSYSTSSKQDQENLSLITNETQGGTVVRVYRENLKRQP